MLTILTHSSLRVTHVRVSVTLARYTRHVRSSIRRDTSVSAGALFTKLSFVLCRTCTILHIQSTFCPGNYIIPENINNPQKYYYYYYALLQSLTCHWSCSKRAGDCLKSIELKRESYHMIEHPRLIQTVKFGRDWTKGKSMVALQKSLKQESLVWIGGTTVTPTIKSSLKLQIFKSVLCLCV